MTRPHYEPSAEHPITVTPTGKEVVVTIGGHEVARSSRALSLAEATYPVVQYIPLDDVQQSVLRPSTTSTYCPYKGDAGYYSVETPDGIVDDAIWFYASPYPAVSEIAGHAAFYPDRTTITIAD